MQWDPNQYARYADERSRPFFDLTAYISATTPGRVVDLGCGDGALTAALARRWPDAAILGLDSSPEMIARAAGHASDAVDFVLASAQDFDATDTDVLVSNALLQWVPEHRELLLRWAAQLKVDGWLAFQVPDNFVAPSHRLMRELTESERWWSQLAGVLRHTDAVARPAEYLSLLVDRGLEVTVWQTRYLHLLAGTNPVLDWVRGTGLRPVLAALSPAEQAEFEAEYASRLLLAYPQELYGTVFPFLRTFVVAHKRA